MSAGGPAEPPVRTAAATGAPPLRAAIAGLSDARLHRLTWAIALPSIIANVAGPLVGVVDSWAMGRLGDPLYLAAIAAGSYAFHVLYWSFGFLRMGTTGLVAQAHGRADHDAIARHLAAALLVGLAVAALVLVSAPALFAALADLLALKADVRETAAVYWRIRVWGAPAILARLALVGTLIGLQAARSAMIVEVALNAVNALLTALLVVGLGMGIAGAAWGSLAAEILAVLLAGLLVGAHVRGRPGLDAARLLAAARRLAPRELLHVARINGFIFLRTLLLLAAFGLFWRESAELGTMTLAANQVAINLLMLTSFGLDGLAYAAEALVGEAAGRGARTQILARVAVTGLWSAVMAAGYALVWSLAADAIFALFTDDPAVLAITAHVKPVVVLLPLAGFLSYHMDGVFIGLAAARAMFVTMALAFAGYGLALALFVAPDGARGLWLALGLFLLLRGLLQLGWLVRWGPAGSGR
ncbi:MAG: MATE family efflux transporter [Rhodothalassiaceae bacterium]|nr:MAG: MATE family efflux transporter [Rhodothalassiaceae bacterium]